jgi:chromosome segregation ATPase
MIREIDLRVKDFCFHKISMEEWSCKLDLKERELEGLFEKFELRGQQFQPKVEELHVIDKRVDECLNEVLLREMYLETLEKSIKERDKSLDSVSHELLMKEGRLELLEKDLELKRIQVETEQLERENHFASLEKSMEEREKAMDALENSLRESKEHSERQLEEQGRELQSKQKLFDSQQMEREEHLDSLEKSIQEREKQFTAFQKSVQEQKKYFDSLSNRLCMKERQLEKKGKELELKLKHLESQVMTEQLEPTLFANNMIIPSCVSDQLNINTDGRSLQLSMNEQSKKVELVGSQMSALLNADEIVKLVGIISQHKQTLQLFQTLGFEDKIPGKCSEYWLL